MASSSKVPALHIANNLRIAAEDLQGSISLAEVGNRNEAYLLEQAAEKLLQAHLVAEGLFVERRHAHRIDVLVDKLPAENPIKEGFSGLLSLTAYATTYRYTKDGGRQPTRPKPGELVPARERIGAMIEESAEHFGVSLGDPDHVPAANAEPYRSVGKVSRP